MLLCPSMMCADYTRLGEETRALDEAGADIMHCDIMDGSFVPNMAMGPMDVKAVKSATSKPVDVHLMIENPASKVDWFIDAGADIVYIHPESERYVIKTLIHIHDRGVKTGIAISPDISVESIHELLCYCDYVMVMTVNPGFAGQKFIDSMLGKIQTLADKKEKFGYHLMIDGNCSPQKIAQTSTLGVEGFVLGTSAVFGKGKPYAQAMAEIRLLEKTK